MADFEPAFQRMMRNEGGFKLHKVEGDRGGMTFAGIARKFHPGWEGWKLLDRGDTENPQLTMMVRRFYDAKFWDLIGGDDIKDQRIAETLFDFAVNAGHRTAIKLAQIASGSTPDGILGPNTLRALNGVDPEEFELKYALAKVARYAEICNRDRSQSKFLLGWLNRTLKGVAS